MTRKANRGAEDGMGDDYNMDSLFAGDLPDEDEEKDGVPEDIDLDVEHELSTIAQLKLLADDPVHVYLDAIGKYPLLDAETERKLTLAWANDRDYEARQTLANHNLRLVVAIAKKYYQPVESSLSFMDLIQYGSIGILDAIDRFDPTRNNRFSTYAVWRIRHQISKAVMKHSRSIRLPASVHAMVGKMRKAMQLLNKALEREPTIEEIAEAMGIPVSEAQEAYSLIVRGHTLSLDAAAGDDDLGSFVSNSDPLPDEQVADRLLGDMVRKALNRLLPIEKTILTYRMGLHDGRIWTLEEVGVVVGKTRERVRQLETKALLKMRHPAIARLLQDYENGVRVHKAPQNEPNTGAD